MEPAVSVILPTYNRKGMLEAAVESVLAQSFSSFELIIVDDCSDDGTEDLYNKDSRIRYLRLPYHCGVSYARNVGVGAAKAPIIAFIDSDDLWHKEKLQKQVCWLKENPSSRIVQSKEIWIRNGKRVNPPKTHEKKGGMIFEESLQRCMITPSSVMLYKDLFEEVGGFNESLPACEDYDLWLKITCRYPVGLIQEYLLTRYGGHKDQLSSTVPILDSYRVRSLLDLLRSPLLSEPQKKLAREVLRKKATIVATGYKKRGKEELYERYNAIAKTC